MFGLTRHCAIASTMALGVAGGAQAAVVSINLLDTDQAAFALGSSEIAGVVTVDDWNNVNPGSSVSNLVNDLGVATTIDIASSATYNNDIDGPGGSADNKMLSSADTINYSSTGTYTLSEIAYATYDIYVYIGDQVSGAGKVTNNVTVGISGSGTTFGLNTTEDNVAPFALADSLTGDASLDTGNYVLWTGLTGSSQVISLTVPAVHQGGGRVGVAGILIVENVIPEPASLALMGLGGLLMLGRSRRLA